LAKHAAAYSSRIRARSTVGASVHPVAQVQRRRTEEGDRDPQLRLTDDVGDRFDVHRVHREQRGRDPCGKREAAAATRNTSHAASAYSAMFTAWKTIGFRCPSIASTRKARMVSGR
jgi:hypothetical protein